MKYRAYVKAAMLMAGCFGMLVPVSALEAATVSDIAGSGRPMVEDVELDRHGTLHGTVVDVQNVPIAEATVTVLHNDREVARARTDPSGRFLVVGLRGGSYRVMANHRVMASLGARQFRAWAADTAPPGASGTVRISVGDDVVRGQIPLKEFVFSDCVLLTGLTAAMIAVPIAVYSTNRGSPASP